MKLARILRGAGLAAADLGAAGDADVTGFAIDHRKVAPGTIFGAFRGARFDGEDFIAAAVESGAVAIVARPEAVVDALPGRWVATASECGSATWCVVARA